VPADAALDRPGVRLDVRFGIVSKSSEVVSEMGL
jgi:hypothetical protein